MSKITKVLSIVNGSGTLYTCPSTKYAEVFTQFVGAVSLKVGEVVYNNVSGSATNVYGQNGGQKQSTHNLIAPSQTIVGSGTFTFVIKEYDLP